jgi:hypothetical protein
MSECIGLWLAYWALRLTGNRELANVSKVLPLIPRRRLAIGSESLDRQASPLLFGRESWLWSPPRAH